MLIHSVYKSVAVLCLFALCHIPLPAAAFDLVNNGNTVPLVVDGNDFPGVVRAVNDLRDDVFRVASVKPEVRRSAKLPADKGCVIIGTIGHSTLIDRLVRQGKLRVDGVKGRWESYVRQMVDGNLVIAGSDKRGTIYGVYDISEMIGVSPWYWWADAVPEHRDHLRIDGARYVQPSPKVKYRGLFINDEEPSFGSWSRNHFGGYNSKMYTRLFELILRLKANYLWPAMWNARFNEDDTLNPRLADEYGVVMGTSHHEPMMRAHKEYTVRRDSVGPWNYAVNKDRLDRFFREGIHRNRGYENIITIGMRGDGDVAMGSGDDSDNMQVLRQVVDNQRRIIREEYGQRDVPQLWAIFTEVQRYYDAGFTVPDDVTLLFCDNNWGYIRRTGPQQERQRSGGMGLYYHIDMNGGPWNDRWVNTTTIPKLREQLNLAYQTGIDRIWLINVGDLKPKEVPIDFIMHYAWDPAAVRAGDERAWLQRFAAGIFGQQHAAGVADIIARYSKYNLWRKPEVQTTDYFSVENNGEARMLIDKWEQLRNDAERLRPLIPERLQDAFYQLVYYPAVASAGVAQLYLYAGLHNHYARQGVMTHYADSARRLFELDKVLSRHYNDSLAGGKWRGMMSDRHIGYTRWSMPPENVMPPLLPVDTGKRAVPGVADAAPVVRYAREIGIPAYRYLRQQGDGWIFLPDLGRGKGCMGARDVTRPFDGNWAACPYLEYEVETGDTTRLQVALGILPTQDVNPRRGLRVAVSVDGGEPRVIDARRGLVDTFDEYSPKHLKLSHALKPLPPHNRDLYLTGGGKHMRNEVFDNIRWLDDTFDVDGSSGRHIVRVYLVDPEIVLERLIVNPDNDRPSYFGRWTE